jgi:hypothetical protein
VTKTLSLWRFPLDQVALAGAELLLHQQPRCSIGAGEDFSAMTIFNYGYYLDQPLATPDLALTAMFNAMNPGPYAVGGLAFIPQNVLSADVHASAAGFAVPDQCNIVASGVGGAPFGAPAFYHFTIDYSHGSIFLSCSGNYTSGGKYFRNLAFFGTGVSSTADTCISAGTENCRAVNCTFTDIPLAFDAQGDGCALEQCTIYYDGMSGMTVPVKAVVIAGAQCGVFGPGEIFQQPQKPGGGGGPTNCTAISIEGAEHTVIADIHLSEWNIGVDFMQTVGARHTAIRNCEIQSWQSALNIKLPASTSGSTADIKVTGCILAKSDVSTDLTAVVVIDPQGNTNTQLNDITLLDCTVFNGASSTTAAQHGLQIAGGTNIQIIGGTYSNNSKVGGAGIAITGACGDVQIIGANLQPSYPWAGTTMGPVLNNQQYGLLVTAPPAGTVYVADCDLTGYTHTSPPQQAVSVTVTPLTSGLFIYNCPGYNDQSTTLNGNLPPTAITNSAATCSNPYFGPSVILFSNSTPVTLHVFGQTITKDFGIIVLPSPYDIFYFSGTVPMAFSWIGK